MRLATITELERVTTLGVKKNSSIRSMDSNGARSKDCNSARNDADKGARSKTGKHRKIIGLNNHLSQLSTLVYTRGRWFKNLY